MPEPEQINDQLELLALHRRTHAILLKQLAQLGSSHAPPGIFHGIREAQISIRRVKTILQTWNILFEEHPDDEDDANAPLRVDISSENYATVQSETSKPSAHSSKSRVAQVTDIRDNTFSVDSGSIRIGGCDFIVLDDTEINLRGVEILDLIELTRQRHWFVAHVEVRLIDATVAKGEITFTELPSLSASSSFLTIDTELQYIKRVQFVN